MTTLIVIFMLALGLGLLLTPRVRDLALARGLFDRQSGRKIHKGDIPRVGGVALYGAFFATLALAWVYPTDIVRQMKPDPEMIGIMVGATLIFLLGLWDDVKGLNAYVKGSVQIIAASITCSFGIHIEAITAGPGSGITLGWLSYPVTVLWFLLVVNAINLIDGLDGLAAGVSLFASIVLLIICIVTQRYQVALGFAALGGATLGFLRYNFNPASIFMGDSGSYFLGYMLAGLSIVGSVKSTASVALLIPVIALGVPLIDSLTAPLRRFIRGRNIFSPDKGHLHHRLLRLGLNQRNSVLILYSATIFMGIVAISMVYASSELVALILLLLGAMVVICFRKLGYMEYLAFDKLYGWVRDVTDEVGISHDRRSFLNLQMEMAASRDLPTLWGHVTQALDRLGFDFAEIDLNINGKSQSACTRPTDHGISTFADGENGNAYRWQRNSGYHFETACVENLLKLELPLLDNDARALGHMRLVKDLNREAISHYTLRRVEHLRRSVMGTLRNLI